MGGIGRTPPGGWPVREQLRGQGGQRVADDPQPEGQGLPTTPRVRRPRVRFSPSPPAASLVSLGRPKFQRRRGPGGQSQDFLHRMGQVLADGEQQGGADDREVPEDEVQEGLGRESAGEGASDEHLAGETDEREAPEREGGEQASGGAGVLAHLLASPQLLTGEECVIEQTDSEGEDVLECDDEEVSTQDLQRRLVRLRSVSPLALHQESGGEQGLTGEQEEVSGRTAGLGFEQEEGRHQDEEEVAEEDQQVQEVGLRVGQEAGVQ